MEKATAEKYAKHYIELMKIVKQPISEELFIFNYNGGKDDGELIWYYIDMWK